MPSPGCSPRPASPSARAPRRERRWPRSGAAPASGSRRGGGPTSTSSAATRSTTPRCTPAPPPPPRCAAGRLSMHCRASAGAGPGRRQICNHARHDAIIAARLALMRRWGRFQCAVRARGLALCWRARRACFRWWTGFACPLTGRPSPRASLREIQARLSSRRCMVPRPRLDNGFAHSSVCCAKRGELLPPPETSSAARRRGHRIPVPSAETAAAAAATPGPVVKDSEWPSATSALEALLAVDLGANMEGLESAAAMEGLKLVATIMGVTEAALATLMGMYMGEAIQMEWGG